MVANVMSRRQAVVRTGAALATGALATVALPAVARADDDHSKHGGLGGQLIGTWLVDSTSDVGLPTRQTLTSFIPGGIVVAVDGSLQDPAPAGLGTWQKRGSREYAATFQTFLYEPPGNPPLDRVGVIKVVAEASLSRDSLSGRYRTAATDDSGNVFYEDRGTFTGSRVGIEPV
jgi:hypothetical protein